MWNDSVNSLVWFVNSHSFIRIWISHFSSHKSKHTFEQISFHQMSIFIRRCTDLSGIEPEISTFTLFIVYISYSKNDGCSEIELHSIERFKLKTQTQFLIILVCSECFLQNWFLCVFYLLFFFSVSFYFSFSVQHWMFVV